MSKEVSEAENRHDENAEAPSRIVWEMSNSFSNGENPNLR